MPTLTETPRKRKSNTEIAADAIVKASVELLLSYPDGLIYPANPKTKVPLFERYNSVRRSPADLEQWLAEFPRYVPAIIPQKFGLLGIDIDQGDKGELVDALAIEGIDALVVRSFERGWHVYVRCKLAASRIPAKWAAFGASGDLRYRTNILLYRDSVLQLRDFLSRRGGAISGAFRDGLVAQQVEVPGERAYNTAELEHGRSVYMESLKRRPTPTWPGAVAQLEGMAADSIKPNELKAVEAAQARMEQATAAVQDAFAGAGYRGRILDTLAAMVALGTQGSCWASHRTIALVAGFGAGSRRMVIRHQERLERDGVIERTGRPGKAWRGSSTVDWRINLPIEHMSVTQ